MAAIGAASLAGWFLNIPLLAAWKVETLPMAPATAVLSVLLGLALAASSRAVVGARHLILARTLAIIGGVAAFVFLAMRAGGWLPRFELLSLPIAGAIEGAPIGFVSPVTAACFTMANAAVLLLIAHPARDSWPAVSGRVGGAVLALVGLVLGVANVLGAPLLSGLVIIPVALNTSVVLLLAGLALLRLSGRARAAAPGGTPIRPFVWIFVGIGVMSTAVGYAYYRQLERDLRAEVERELTTVVELIRSGLGQWRKERQGDALSFRNNDLITAMLGRTQADRPADEPPDDWLRELNTSLQYDRMFLFDSGGALRQAFPDRGERPSAAITVQVTPVLRSGQALLQDFYLDEGAGRAYLGLLVPIADSVARDRPIGLLALRIDPEPFLFSLIRGWPTTSTTAEAALVRRDGDEVVFLNDLRFNQGTALRVRVPVSETDVLAVKAVAGQTGIVQGVDYRGAPSIGVVGAIPDTPWHLVVGIQLAEFNSRLWERLRVVSALVAMLLFSAGSVLGLVWRNRRLAFYRDRAALATALETTSTQLLGMLGSSPTIIYRLTRVDGRLVPTDVSENVRRILGYSHTEVLQLHWWISNLHPDDREAALAAIAALDRVDELTHEYRFYRKDGKELWISDRLRVVRRDAHGVAEVTGAWSEVTERRKAEEFLRDSEERLRMALSASNQGTFDLNVQTGEAVVSPEYETQLGYAPDELVESNAAWLARIHPEDRPRTQVAYQDYVDGRTADYRVEFRQRTKQGSWLWTLSVGRVVSYTPDGQPLRMLGTHTDIHARKIAELRSQRLAQMYAALSRCNEAIVRSASEAELFPLICEAAVTHGGMAMAWVGMADQASGAVTPVAWFGNGTEYLDGIEVSVLGDSPFGRGPTGTSIRENRAIWLDNFQTDPSTEPWHRRAQRFGWAASVGLPLTRDGRAVGALTIYARTADAFDHDGRELLAQMAADISFALDTFGHDARRIGAEAAVRASLHEKEALLKEVHHRVKNNLQVITSLLRLEAGRSSQPDVVAVLAEMQSRVLSMALLHETLYRSDNLALVDLAAYLTQLGHQIVRSLAPAAGVTLQLDVEPIRLDLDQAVPCGLIVNELMSNALKHAFPDGRHGDIRITARLVDGGPALRLSVADAGAGLPADFNEARTRSLGLRLVTDLVRQLHGTLDISSGYGTTFSLTFTPKSTAVVQESPAAS